MGGPGPGLIRLSQLLIRADSGTRMGMGHVMRCLALALAWQERGGEATLLTCSEGDGARRRFARFGFRVMALRARHPDPDDLDATLRELERLKGRDPGGPRPWLATDGYFFSPAFHEAVRAAGFPLLVLDDIADQPRYVADLLLNQNLGAEHFAYDCAPETVRLLGTRYALLRPEFRHGETEKAEVPELARRILVTLGGGDPDNLTLRVLRSLQRTELPGLEVVAVVGGGNPHRDALEVVAGGSRDVSIRLVYDADNMAELMAWADLAVSAAGSTCWELAATGVPAVLLVAAENQREIATALAQEGIAMNLGWHEAVAPDRLTDAVRRAARDRSWRAEARRRGRTQVDGAGAGRVAAQMMERTLLEHEHRLALRMARPEDADALWHLAQDPTMQDVASDPSPVPLEEHRAGFLKTLEEDEAMMWVLASPEGVMGRLRFERSSAREAWGDVLLAGRVRGMGLEARLLDLTADLACDRLGVDRVVAKVPASNAAFARALEEAGFAEREGTSPGDRTTRVFSRPSPCPRRHDRALRPGPA